MPGVRAEFGVAADPGEVYWRREGAGKGFMGVTLPSGRLVSRVGDGDVPGPAEDDWKGHVLLLAPESEKEISCLE